MSTVRTEANLNEILAALGRDKVTAVVRTKDPEAARQATEAVIRGGFTSVEFTLTIPNALELIAEYSKRPGILVGGGTIFTTQDAEKIVTAGAHFVVCPILEPSVIKWCVCRNIPVMAGISSPSEMWEAHKLGAHVAKLFPGAAGGPAFVKAVRGPMPFLRIVPTTGATEENCAEYMENGCFGIGFTGVLFDAEDMANGRWDRIEARARRMATKVRGVPQPRL